MQGLDKPVHPGDARGRQGDLASELIPQYAQILPTAPGPRGIRSPWVSSEHGCVLTACSQFPSPSPGQGPLHAPRGAPAQGRSGPARPLLREPLVRAHLAAATPASRFLTLPHLSDLERGSNCFPFSGCCAIATEEKPSVLDVMDQEGNQVPGPPRKGNSDSGSQPSEEPLGPVPGSEDKGLHWRFCHVTSEMGVGCDSGASVLLASQLC